MMKTKPIYHRRLKRGTQNILAAAAGAEGSSKYFSRNGRKELARKIKEARRRGGSGSLGYRYEGAEMLRTKYASYPHLADFGRLHP